MSPYISLSGPCSIISSVTAARTAITYGVFLRIITKGQQSLGGMLHNFREHTHLIFTQSHIQRPAASNKILIIMCINPPMNIVSKYTIHCFLSKCFFLSK